MREGGRTRSSQGGGGHPLTRQSRATNPQNSRRLDVTLADGSVTHVYANGLVIRTSTAGTGPQGMLEILRPDGEKTTFDAAGVPSTLDAFDEPCTTTVGENGSFTTEGDWGSLEVDGPSNWTWTAASGVVLTVTGSLQEGSTPTVEGFSIDGQVNAASGWNHGWVVEADLSVSLYRAVPSLQGVYEGIHIGADGSVEHAFASGVTVRSFLDGSAILTDVLGHTAVIDGQGTVTQPATSSGTTWSLLPDGSREGHAASGASLAMEPNGQVTFTWPDDRQVVLDASGTVLSALGADGNNLISQGWHVERSTVPGGYQVSLQSPEPRHTSTIGPDLACVEATCWGVTHTVRPDTSETWSLPGGITAEVSASGTITARDAHGRAIAATRDAEGDLVLTDLRGITATLPANGEVGYRVGDVTVTLSGGHQSVVTRTFSVDDGTVVTTQYGWVSAWGSHDRFGGSAKDWAHSSVDGAGNVLFTDADGTPRTFVDVSRIFGQLDAPPSDASLLDDGTVVRDLGNGILEFTRLSGVVERHAKNGLVEIRDNDGQVHWRLPEGTWVTRHREGDLEGRGFGWVLQLPTDVQGGPFYPTQEPDGWIRAVLSDGTAYRFNQQTLAVERVGDDGSGYRLAADGMGSIINDHAAEVVGVMRHANPDGSVAMRDVSMGALTFEFPDPSTTTSTLADGTIQATSSVGTVSLYEMDGTLISSATSNQQARTYYRDGTLESLRLGSGLYVTFDHGAPNRTIELPGGLLIHCHANSTDVPGSADSAYALGDGYYAESEDDGTVNVYDHVGTLSWSVGAGFRWTSYSSGHVDRMGLPNGDLESFDARGHLKSTKHLDGTTDLLQADGSTQRRDANDVLLGITRADGAIAVLQVDGSWLATASDGSMVLYGADGSPEV